MLSTAPSPIIVPSPTEHTNNGGANLPLPSATPGRGGSSRCNFLPERDDDDRGTKLNNEVKTLRMLFGGSLVLLLLCIVMLLVVSFVPLRSNPSSPSSNDERTIKQRNRYSLPPPPPVRRIDPFHLTDGALDTFGDMDGMLLQGMLSADGAPVERYYRIQRVIRTPLNYHQQQQQQQQQVRIEFIGGDFMITDNKTAALFRRRDAEDPLSEIQCATLQPFDTDIPPPPVSPMSANLTTSSTSIPLQSKYCPVAILMNPELLQQDELNEEDVVSSSSSPSSRGLQGRTSINFPYRDGGYNYASGYGNYFFNTGRIYPYGVAQGSRRATNSFFYGY